MYASIDDVLNMIKPQLQYGVNAEIGQVTNETITDFIEYADSEIETDIGHMYITPLRKYRYQGVLQYPRMIVLAVACKAAAMIINKYFAEADPGLSERADELIARYDGIVKQILDAMGLLPGQKRAARSHAITPSIQEGQFRERE